jgi:hypothetical protein
MSNEAWIILAVAVLLFAGLVILIVRGQGAAILSLLTAIWTSPVGRHALLIIALLLAFEGLKSFTRKIAEEKASEWLTSYNGSATTDVVGAIKSTVPGLLSVSNPSPSPTAAPTPSLTPTPTPVGTPAEASLATSNVTTATTTNSPTPTPSPTPTEAEQKRLDAQLRTIQDRVKHHGTVMAYFYVSYFESILLVMSAGLVVAITLFFIAQAGWNGTNSYVRAVFIVASAVAAFYGLFPPVFQQQKNIADNKELFLQYKTLESEVDSYSLTLTTLTGEQKSPREFINHVDAEMAKMGNIALGFDISKISYDQFIDLGKGRAAPSPSPGTSSNATPSPPKKP